MPFQTCIKWQLGPVFHKRVVIRMCVGRLETSESALDRFNAVVFEKTISNFLQLFCAKFSLGFSVGCVFFPCFSTYCMFQKHLKPRFSLIFHERVATRLCVSRLETSGSALERFNTEVFEKTIFKIFATFFVRKFSLGFR